MLGHVGLALAEAPDDDRPRLKREFRDVMTRFLEGLRPAAGAEATVRRLRRRK